MLPSCRMNVRFFQWSWRGLQLTLVILMATGNSAGAQSPPPASDPYAWYQGDNGLSAGADGLTISAWTNQSTRSVSGTTTAGRSLTSISGAPRRFRVVLAGGTTSYVARCGGNTDGIWCTQSLFGNITTSRTVIVRTRLNSLQRGFLFDSSSFSGGLSRGQVYTNAWNLGVEAAGSAKPTATNTYKATLTATTNVWQTHVFEFRVYARTSSKLGVILKHYVDGAQVGSTTTNTTTGGGLSGFILGANVQAQLGQSADIAEALVYDRVLSDGDRQAVEAYLAAKWDGAADAPEPVPPDTIVFTRPFYSGMNGYNTYRIPALVTSTRGTVIAAADGRVTSSGDVPSRIDNVIRRSLDLGATWGPLIVTANYGSDTTDTDTYPILGAATPQARTSASDPALLVDRATGRIWVLYDNGSTASYSGFGRVIKLELRYSDDDGLTWSDRVDVEADNPGLRPAAAETYVFNGTTYTFGTAEFLAGPGNGIQIENGPYAGRLIFPVYWYRTSNCSLLIYSDDHGRTWHRGGICGVGTGEVQIAETADGGLLASMRPSGAASGYRWFSRSADGGATWSAMFRFDAAAATPVPDPACQGNVFRLSWLADGRSRLVHANAASTSSRVNMTVRLSYDEGVSWTVSKLIYSGSSAYSSITRLPTGEVGLLFERDNYTAIDFTRLPLDTLSRGADSLPAYQMWANGEFTPEQLMNPTVSGRAADPDGDGAANETEFPFGSKPLAGSSTPAGLTVAPGAQEGADLVTYRRRLNAAAWGLTYTLECSVGGLQAWQPVTGVETGTTLNAEGLTETVELRCEPHDPAASLLFYRVRVDGL